MAKRQRAVAKTKLLLAKGAKLRGTPEKIEQFGIYSFFCEDPNGYLIEVQTFL